MKYFCSSLNSNYSKSTQNMVSHYWSFCGHTLLHTSIRFWWACHYIDNDKKSHNLVRFPDPTYGVGRENEPLRSCRFVLPTHTVDLVGEPDHTQLPFQPLSLPPLSNLTSSQKLGRHALHRVRSVLKSLGWVSFGSKMFGLKILAYLHSCILSY